jgi:hypothetical protein
MSAILSADDLNDFISPGVACIKPVETLPAKPKNEEVSSTLKVTCLYIESDIRLPPSESI